MNPSIKLPFTRKLTHYCLGARGVTALATVFASSSSAAEIRTDVPDLTLVFPFANNLGESTDIFVDFGDAFTPGSATFGRADGGIPLEAEFRLSLNAQADKPYAKGPTPGNGGLTFIANTGVEAAGPFGPIGGRYASKLQEGDSVKTQNFTRPPNDDSVAYLRTPITADSQWAPGDTGYIGLQVNISGNTHYGWAKVGVGADSVTLMEFAYEDTPNADIVVVPEPNSVLLLAAGSTGLATLRRRSA